MSYRCLGILGAGVIGAAWAARASLCGYRVLVYDLSDAGRRNVERAMAHALRSYRRLTLAPLQASGEVTFVDSMAVLAAESDFIQESLPEVPDLKVRILGELSAIAAEDIIIASSTSGILPSLLQSEMVHPQRFIVGHPFNPVYLMPLVELCGGELTSDATRVRAREFYESLGMHVLLLAREVSGFIADRLMEALWREALWMVHDGVADVSAIDDALRFGPGLRWSFMGSFLTYRLAGGSGGMRHFLHHFAPSLAWDWTRLQAPPWSDALADRIVAQSDIQAGDRTSEDYERLRDDCLVSVLQALRGCGFGAGESLQKLEAILFESSHAGSMESVDIGSALVLHHAEVLPEWLDYNGHMTESRYLQVFGDASDAFYRFIGCDSAYHSSGFSFFTAETHLRHLREALSREKLHASTQILAMGDKTLHFFHALYSGEDSVLVATCEQLAVHVATASGTGAALSESPLYERLSEISAAHKALPYPQGAGRAVGDKKL